MQQGTLFAAMMQAIRSRTKPSDGQGFADFEQLTLIRFLQDLTGQPISKEDLHRATTGRAAMRTVQEWIKKLHRKGLIERTKPNRWQISQEGQTYLKELQMNADLIAEDLRRRFTPSE